MGQYPFSLFCSVAEVVLKVVWLEGVVGAGDFALCPPPDRHDSESLESTLSVDCKEEVSLSKLTIVFSPYIS